MVKLYLKALTPASAVEEGTKEKYYILISLILCIGVEAAY